MSTAQKSFVALRSPTEARPPHKAPAANHNLIRNSLSFPAWLAIGAVTQSVLFLVAGRLAILPAIAFLAYNSIVVYAMTNGWIKNPEMEDVIRTKFSAQFPDSHGEFGSQPANSDIVVLLIGARANHPLGVLAPGFRELGSHFDKMNKDLRERSEEFEFLGASSWSDAVSSVSNPGNMQVCYFRSTEGLHKFAHSDLHMAGWKWFNSIQKENPHISIWHETYHAPKGHWETIYANSKLNINFNSTSHRYIDEKTGKEMWASPVVDATKGLLKSATGRMSGMKSPGNDYPVV